MTFFILSQRSGNGKSVLRFFHLQYTVAAIICQPFTYCIFQQISAFFFVFFYHFLSIVYFLEQKKTPQLIFSAESLSFFLFHAEPRTTRLTGMVVTFGTISPFLLRSIYAMESSDISSIG